MKPKPFLILFSFIVSTLKALPTNRLEALYSSTDGRYDNLKDTGSVDSYSHITKIEVRVSNGHLH